MPTILFTNKYQGEPLRIIQESLPQGFDMMMLPESSHASLVENVSKADYILAGGRLVIDKEVLEKAINLKMIQRSGVGLDSIDLNALKEKSIPLYVNRGINSDSVAEHTLLLILAVLKRLTTINDELHAGIWKKQANGVRNYELKGKAIGVIGMGEIGQKVVRMLQGFGVHIIYYDIYRLPQEKEHELNISYLPFDELLSKVDILSFHCALTDATRNMLGKAQISKMKPGAFVINTARGGLIDEKALAEALQSGHIAGAGLDVHAIEPIAEDDKFMNLPNVIMTPHIGGVTYDSFKGMMTEAMRNIQCFEQGDLSVIEDKLYKI